VNINFSKKPMYTLLLNTFSDSLPRLFPMDANAKSHPFSPLNQKALIELSQQGFKLLVFAMGCVKRDSRLMNFMIQGIFSLLLAGLKARLQLTSTPRTYLSTQSGLIASEGQFLASSALASKSSPESVTTLGAILLGSLMMMGLHRDNTAALLTTLVSAVITALFCLQNRHLQLSITQTQQTLQQSQALQLAQNQQMLQDSQALQLTLQRAVEKLQATALQQQYQSTEIQKTLAQATITPKPSRILRELVKSHFRPTPPIEDRLPCMFFRNPLTPGLGDSPQSTVRSGLRI
jgi:hypothetical protein